MPLKPKLPLVGAVSATHKHPLLKKVWNMKANAGGGVGRGCSSMDPVVVFMKSSE